MLRLAVWKIGHGGFDTDTGGSDVPPHLDGILAGIRETDADVIGLLDAWRWRELPLVRAKLRALGYSRVRHILLDDRRVDPLSGITLLVRVRPAVCTEMSWGAVWLHNRYGVRVRLETRGGARAWVYICDLDQPGSGGREAQGASLMRHILKHPRNVRVTVLGNVGGLRELEDTGAPGEYRVVCRNWAPVRRHTWPPCGQDQSPIGADFEN